MVKNKILTALLGVCIAILVITVSIGLPIYVRPFYYAHIDALDMTEYTGLTKEEIKDGYDEVLDFLTLPGKEFGTGVFKYSEEGKSHFEDCKVLFDLNITMLIISLVGAVALLILYKKGVYKLCQPHGFNLLFTVGAYTLGTFGTIAALASINFDKAFEIFHKIFFPGKDNWLFDPRTDQIIYVMPSEFFMNCAILIVSSIILCCLGFIVFSIIWKKKREKHLD